MTHTDSTRPRTEHTHKGQRPQTSRAIFPQVCNLKPIGREHQTNPSWRGAWVAQSSSVWKKIKFLQHLRFLKICKFICFSPILLLFSIYKYGRHYFLFPQYLLPSSSTVIVFLAGCPAKEYLSQNHLQWGVVIWPSSSHWDMNRSDTCTFHRMALESLPNVLFLLLAGIWKWWQELWQPSWTRKRKPILK